MPNSQCNTCIMAGVECTYQETSKKRGPPKGYVESLEIRLAKSEQLIAQLNPNLDLEVELGSPLDKASFAGQRTSKGSKHPTPPPAQDHPFSNYSSQYPLDPASSTEYHPDELPHYPISSSTRTSFAHPSLPSYPSSSSVSNAYAYPTSGERASSISADSRKPISGGAGRAPEGEPPIDEEAELKSFVQLTDRRDEQQLFKRFQGKSSGLPLLFAALGFKYGLDAHRYGQEIKLHRTTSRSRYWRIPPWESTPGVFSSIPKPTTSNRAFSQDTDHGSSTNAPSTTIKNPQLEAMMSSNPFASWPDQGLDWRLIEGYFDYVNVLLPLLHRPTFYRQYASQLYNTDPGFARTCLLVFAVGSHHCDDPRVYFPREDGGENYGVDSAGWIYYHAFGRMVRHRLAPTELWDLQVSVLLVQFLRHSSQPGACWLLVGEGLRYAQDIGVHRKGVKRSPDPVDNELFKRGFWCLYLLEREFSAFMGRPLAPDEEFDLDLPAECDDDYWQTGFVQPPHEPSVVSAFIMNIKLNRILASALVQLYNIKPSHMRPHAPTEIALELEKRMKAWLLSMPDHLKWDPRQPDSIFYRQSTDLYLNYNMVLTYIHRPFLPSPRAPIPTSPSSFATCMAAANAVADILDNYYRRVHEAYPYVFNPAYTAALVLLIGYWSPHQNGLIDRELAMQGIQQCLSCLDEGEKMYFGIGRAKDAITVLRTPRNEPSSQNQPTGGPRYQPRQAYTPSNLPTQPLPLSNRPRNSHLTDYPADQARYRPLSNPPFTPPMFSPSVPEGSTPDFARATASLAMPTEFFDDGEDDLDDGGHVFDSADFDFFPHPDGEPMPPPPPPGRRREDHHFAPIQPVQSLPWGRS